MFRVVLVTLSCHCSLLCHRARCACYAAFYLPVSNGRIPVCKRNSHTYIVVLCARTDIVIIAPYSGTEHLADVYMYIYIYPYVAHLPMCARADNVIIAPYSGTEHLADVIAGVTNTTTPRPSERPVLAFFRGNCGPWENVAKRMRHAMVGALRQGNSSEIDACCLGARATGFLEFAPVVCCLGARVRV